MATVSVELNDAAHALHAAKDAWAGKMQTSIG
jgi:hypothetical protein